MSSRVVSVNVGSARPTSASRARRTGIDKQPAPGIDVRAPGPKHGGLGSGVVGDFIGSTKHHGGDDQAIYAFAREELDRWQDDLGRELADGCFGENLTTSGLDVDAALVGERWTVGATTLEVCGPRVPCATFATAMGEQAWVRRFTEVGRTGAYLAVVVPGTIRPEDPIEVVYRPTHEITVPMLFRAWNGDLALADAVLGSGCLSERRQAELEARVAKRRTSPIRPR